jgi:anti-anti-sigma factor
MEQEIVSVDIAPYVEVALARGPFAGVVTLHGEHDLATRDQLEDAFGAIFGSVLIDLTDCTFIDSTVIATLVQHARRVDREGHRFEAVAPPANVAITRIIDVCGLRELVTVHDTLPV